MNILKNWLAALVLATSMTSCADFTDQQVARVDAHETLTQESVSINENMNASVDKMQKYNVHNLYADTSKRGPRSNLSYDPNMDEYMLVLGTANYVIVWLDDGSWSVQQAHEDVLQEDGSIVRKQFVPSPDHIETVNNALYWIVTLGEPND